MNPYRKISVFVGILFLVGTGAGILSNGVTQPLLNVPNYLQNIAAHETQWVAGALLILAGVMVSELLGQVTGPDAENRGAPKPEPAEPDNANAGRRV